LREEENDGSGGGVLRGFWIGMPRGVGAWSARETA
jgi:hypothetical protein